MSRRFSDTVIRIPTGIMRAPFFQPRQLYIWRDFGVLCFVTINGMEKADINKTEFQKLKNINLCQTRDLLHRLISGELDVSSLPIPRNMAA